MPPKKKSATSKKKALGAARGFATTSVPRRKDPEEEAAAAAAMAEADAAKLNGGGGAEGDGKGDEGGAGGEGKEGEMGGEAGEGVKKDDKEDEWDPEAAEQMELQRLAERIRPGCDKEVSRVVKVIDYERRISKGMPGYNFSSNDQDLQRRILELALEETKDEQPQPLYEPEDKVIAKVATLYGILEQLGFTSERIEECLKTVKVLELDDCMDWLFLHCDSSELGCEGPIVTFEPDVVESVPPTPKAGNSPKASTAPLSRLAAADAKAPAFPSPRSRTTTKDTPLSPSNSNGASGDALRARILEYERELDKQLSPPPSSSLKSATTKHPFFSSGDSDSDSSDSETDSALPDSNAKYASLKLQLSEIQRAQAAHKRATKGKGDRKGAQPMSKEEEQWMEAKAEVLKGKISAVEGEYTFRKTDAEKLYREERTKLDAAQLAARLNGTTLDSVVPGFPSSSSTSSSGTTPASNGNGLAPAAEITSSSTSPSSPPSPSKTSDAGEEGGNLFGNLLDEAPTEETTEEGTTIPVRDLALPKHFSGKTPKASLEETVRKLDKYGTVVFSVISRSRAVRASVTIRWSGSNGDAASGATSLTGANGTNGSNGGSGGANGSTTGRTQTFSMDSLACRDQQQAYNYIATVALHAVTSSKEGSGIQANKALPTAFRDLWDELAEKRKKEDEEEYRGKLKVWKAIAEPRCQVQPSKDSRIAKGEKATVEDNGIIGPKEVPPDVAERIQQEIFQRQTWPTYQEMLRQRANLPIAAYRSIITNAIEDSQCIVLCGETGCGKSTQVPSFILEHGLRLGRDTKIFCTEPRRISAISLAQRVSTELGEPPGACGTRNSYVGYSIRLDSAVSASTRIVYATTGIVLRMLEGKESLADVTHIIIDEVHERSIDSDFLLIVLREILEVRKDLKVILMSATVDAEKIADYMGGCPVVRVPGRTFPVTPYYLEDVVELTRYRLDPHSDSPYIAKNKRAYGARPRRGMEDVPLDDEDEDDPSTNSSEVTHVPISKQSRITLDCMDQHAINYDLIVSLLENLCFYRQDLVQFSSAILIFLPSLESIRRLTDTLEAHQAFGSNQFLVLPLHSTISNENQSLVFNIPRPGVRKIVISTNIAETGVTIPDITAVIDTGKHREMRFDEKRQISRLVETFVAQSNAAQRRGRAGRVREGVAFHLFTKHRHDNYMQEHPQPEMTRLSLQDLALRIKIMKIGTQSIEETLLKALDPPTSANIARAVSALIEVKALTANEDITPLGRHLAALPMDVHLGLFLVVSCTFNCLDAALTITAALSSKSPWVTPFGREAEADAVKRGFDKYNSDFLTLYAAYCGWREACTNNYEHQFVRKSFLSLQNLQQIEELRQQFFSFLVDAGFVNVSNSERRSLVSTRYGKSRTKFTRVPAELDTSSNDPRTVMACLAASMYPKLLTVDPTNGSLRTLANSAPAAIHPSSVNFSPGRRVDYGGNIRFATFFTAMHTKKLYIWESGGVDERAVYLLCGNSDFQLPAHTLSIDRKIRTRLYDPKTLLAIKILRDKWRELFNKKMKDPAAPLEARLEPWLALMRESLESPFKKAEEEDKKNKKEAVRAAVKLSLTRND